MKPQTQVLPGHDKSPRPKPRLSFSVPRRGKPPRHLADLSLEERAHALEELGYPAYRAKQLSTHYFTHLTRNPEDMTDIPLDMREGVVDELLPDLLGEVRRMEADGGATIKTLWNLFDDVKVESVLMAYSDRTTLCVSSQAGCGMACPFCATGQMGLTRNLSTAEIIDQVRQAARMCRDG
ncbi:MAG TPA: 23S rRNA (adenine(2503)-C(2))-methyltransferase RlmN, partial [Beutenbergiaceae bacterium]|nr:23S rRNA (adenine(2503)-C(2))-methyltransferase RlmN [Beutenbergiaceae bacterium]